MRATINGKNYDAEEADCLIHDDSDAETIRLFQTQSAEFFVERSICFVDGRQLKKGETLRERAPELCTMPDDPVSLAAFDTELERRIEHRTSLLPLSLREAMAWCIRIQIPEVFQEHMLERI